LDIIMKSAMDAARTVKRLQDFVRKRDDWPESVADLNEAIRAAAEMTRPRWKSEAEASGVHIELVVEHGERQPLVSGVETELHEILINNAFDAMPDGGKIILSPTNTAGGPRVSVRDTGPGMSPETKERGVQSPFSPPKGEQGTGSEVSFTLPTSDIVDVKWSRLRSPRSARQTFSSLKTNPTWRG
jgi:C4-dicarboxylate-specific signal transduction histidine kinase